MGDVVPIDGGEAKKRNATVGQALYAAVVDELTAMKVTMPPALIAIAVKHGREALEGGVAPETVLAGCLTALRKGRPQFAAHIIGDLVLARAGAYMSEAEYRQLLSLESRANNEAVQSVREALLRHQRKEIGGQRHLEDRD